LVSDKVLLIFYCLIQFRNFKATGLNILYFTVANYLLTKWRSNPQLLIVIDEVLSILGNNIEYNNQSTEYFGESLIYSFLDKGSLYTSINRTYNSSIWNRAISAGISSALSTEDLKRDKDSFINLIKPYFELNTLDVEEISFLYHYVELLIHSEENAIIDLTKKYCSDINHLEEHMKCIKCSMLAVCLYINSFYNITGRLILRNELPSFVCKVLCTDQSKSNEILTSYLHLSTPSTFLPNKRKIVNGIIMLLQLDQYELAFEVLFNSKKELILDKIIVGFNLIEVYLNRTFNIKNVIKSIEEVLNVRTILKNKGLILELIQNAPNDIFRIVISAIALPRLITNLKVISNLRHLENRNISIVISDVICKLFKCSELLNKLLNHLGNMMLVKILLEQLEEFISIIAYFIHTNIVTIKPSIDIMKQGINKFEEILKESIEEGLELIKNIVNSIQSTTIYDDSNDLLKVIIAQDITITKQNLLKETMIQIKEVTGLNDNLKLVMHNTWTIYQVSPSLDDNVIDNNKLIQTLNEIHYLSTNNKEVGLIKEYLNVRIKGTNSLNIKRMLPINSGRCLRSIQSTMHNSSIINLHELRMRKVIKVSIGRLRNVIYELINKLKKRTSRPFKLYRVKSRSKNSVMQVVKIQKRNATELNRELIKNEVKPFVIFKMSTQKYPFLQFDNEVIQKPFLNTRSKAKAYNRLNLSGTFLKKC